MRAEFSQRLLKEKDPDGRQEILAARDRHLKSVFADRDVETKLNQLAEASCSTNCTFNGRTIKFDIDGMDQAKHKCPRNIDSSNSMKDLWRPALHVVGILCWGLFEAFVYAYLICFCLCLLGLGHPLSLSLSLSPSLSLSLSSSRSRNSM